VGKKFLEERHLGTKRDPELMKVRSVVVRGQAGRERNWGGK